MPARAQPKLTVHLEYETDPGVSGCPSEAAFKAMVRGHLGYDPFDAASPHVVVARARADESGLSGSVEWRDAFGALRGERELRSESGDCAELARAMSFAMAVQIQLLAETSDTPATAGSDTPTPVDPTSAAPPTKPTPPRPPAADEGAITRRTASASAQQRWMIGAGPALGFGTAPAPAPGGRVFLAWQLDRLGLELGAEASLWSQFATEDDDGIEQQIALGSLAGCLTLAPFTGCAVSKFGRLQIRGLGVDRPRSASGVLAQLGPRLSLGTELGKRWAGALRIEVLATLATWDVRLNQREIWSAPALTLSVGADLAAIFRNNAAPPATIR